MKLITRYELTTNTEAELYTLLREVFNELAKSTVNSHERRNALASIENILREIDLKSVEPRPE